MVKYIDILFIGSSIISRWEYNNILSSLRIVNLGIDGLQTKDILEPKFINKIIKYFPKFIIYYCGGIDVNKNILIYEIISNITIFIKLIKYIYGNKTKIIKSKKNT